MLLCLQLPMGDSDQGGDEEVPQPHEPQRGGGGRVGAQPGRRGPAAQPPAPQHRVGHPSHRASGKLRRQGGFRLGVGIVLPRLGLGLGLGIVSQSRTESTQSGV